MDFSTEITYSIEQEEFRKGVSVWLNEHAQIPSGLSIPRETGDMSPELYAWVREYRKKLGRKGWLAPLWPAEFGGGGLSVDMAQVLEEELSKRKIPAIYDNRLAAPAMMVWGTEEQKRRFLPLINQGEVITWQAFTEPEVGSDAASITTSAVRDGDDFIINGTKVYIGGPFSADYIWTTAVTDQTSPRHRNLGAFYVPADLPGISFSDMELIVNVGKRFVYYDNVRVPGEYLVGGENQGWQVAQTSLEIEHGAGGSIGEGASRDGGVVAALIAYAQEAVDEQGNPLIEDSRVRELLVEARIETHIVELIALRNYWMFNNQKRMTFHGSQNSLLRKLLAMKLGNIVLEVAGPYAMLDDEKWAPGAGVFESHQRQAITAHHPGGSSEIQKLIMARRLGLSRSKEEAAPTKVA